MIPTFCQANDVHRVRPSARTTQAAERPFNVLDAGLAGHGHRKCGFKRRHSHCEPCVSTRELVTKCKLSCVIDVIAAPTFALKCNAPSARFLEPPNGGKIHGSDNKKSRDNRPLSVGNCRSPSIAAVNFTNTLANGAARIHSLLCQSPNRGSTGYQDQFRRQKNWAIDFHEHVSSNRQGTSPSGPPHLHCKLDL